MIDKKQFLVNVRCATYNHSAYIEDAMNGFAMQQTDFPFVCSIIDDASTDGEQEILKKYLDKNFELGEGSGVINEETDDYVLTLAQHKTNKNCYFAVLFLKYNHYGTSESKARRWTYLKEWEDECKYIALCEGDDYWIDPCKLQRQIEFLETHPNFSMVCNRTKRFSIKKGVFLDDNRCYTHSQVVKPEDVILKGGLFISTCSTVYRRTIINYLPDYCMKCHVGDYPRSIMASMKGQVYYMDDAMSVYRVENSASWVGRQKSPFLTETRLRGILSEVRMLQGFMRDYPQYSVFFMQRQYFIVSNLPNRHTDKEGNILYCRTFKEEIKHFTYKNRIHIFVRIYFPLLLDILAKIRK